jgi:hypothetical protein
MFDIELLRFFSSVTMVKENLMRDGTIVPSWFFFRVIRFTNKKQKFQGGSV